MVALAITGVFAFVVSNGNPNHTSPPPTHAAKNATGPIAHNDPAAVAAVRSALTVSTQAGSYNVNYEFQGFSDPTAPATTTTCPTIVVPQPPGNSVVPPTQVQCSSSPQKGLDITGHGTIDTSPYRIVADSQVPGLGAITLYADDTNVWELNGDDGLSAPAQNGYGTGSTLSGFAGTVEGTLGARQGAMAMMSLANPTGYLDLEQQEITAADEVGTGTVDGATVTQYRIFMTPQQQANLPDLSTEQAKTINAALAILTAAGFQGSSVVVSIDASGYVRETQSSAEFADGSVAKSMSTFSDFGCGGTVLMPNQQGTSAPPAGCVSPDTGQAPTTTSTTASTTSTTSTSS